MEENSRKRCRKAKLVPRECIDYVEDDSDLQGPAYKRLLLDKIKKEPEDNIPEQQTPSTHKFSVEVEIEDMEDTAPDDDATDYMKYLFSLSKQSQETEPETPVMEFADNSLLIEQKLVIPVTEEEKNCNVDVRKLQNMLGILHRKYPREKEVVMHCRNQWGRAFHERCPTECKKTPKEILLQDALLRWKQWTIVTRAKESPYSYKCYICNVGWWTYADFTTHIAQHETCKFQIQTRNIECDIVAYEGESPGAREVEIHGKCTKCARTYDHHLSNKRATDAYYYCNYCDERFQNCRTLNKHEGSCHRNPIRVLAISKAGKEYSFSDFSCVICKTVFLSNTDLDEHMAICHKVRSDEPIVTIFKTCKECELSYYNFFFHVCSKKNFVTECQHCLRKFQNKQMLEHHLKMWDKVVQCQICDKYLLRGCLAAEHYTLHSKEFLLVHRCLLCRKIKVFADDDMLKTHCLKYHKRVDSRRPRSDRIVMPRIMLRQCMVDLVKKGHSRSAQRPPRGKEGGKLARGETVPQVRVYVPIHNKKKPTDGPEISNTTIAHDGTLSLRPEAPSEDSPPGLAPTEDSPPGLAPTEDSSPGLTPTEDSSPGLAPTEDSPPEHAPTEDAPVKIKQEKEDEYENTQPPIEIVPEICEIIIKTEKIDKEITSEVGSSSKNQEDNEQEDRKDMSNILSELTEFLDIKPDIIKEEKVSDDEAAQATQELTNLLQMSNKVESDISASISSVFKASSTFAEEVTDTSEHTTVFHISKTIFEASIKQEKEEPVIKDPIATSNDSSRQSVSETSDVSILNLVPEVILKAGYRKRKIYKCNKCGFSGYHREYKGHINNDCGTPVYKESKAVDTNYVCTKCDKGFPSVKKYALHFEKHGYNYMSCPQCMKGFDGVTRLMSHLDSHLKSQFIKVQLITGCDDSSTKVHQCKKCAETVARSQLFEHWEKHLELMKPPEKPVENLHIGEHGERSINPDSLREVLAILTKQLSSENRLAKSCVVCARVFERRNDTKRHLIEHLLEDAYANIMQNQMLKCQICGDLHKKPDGYKKHMRDHANLPIYKCSLCNKTFSDSSNFTKHKKIHNLKAYICDICSKKFQAKISLEKHIQMHMQTEPITCDQCQRVFHDRSFYRRHYRQYHDKLLTKYRCQLCREKFSTLRDKWDHLWNIHKQRKEAADCPICGVSYRKFIDVKKHAMEVHGQAITLSNLWSLLSKIKVRERLQREGEGSKVKEEVSSDDDCLLIEEEPETLVVYD